ncbi:MAG: gliding motility-associated C-terminal domain-containing protein [Saprospiraceae bacterium]
MKDLACILLFFLFPFFASAQLEGKITLLPDQKTYQVSVISSADWSPPASNTPGGQITLVVPAGGFFLVNLQNVTGGWTHNTTVRRPIENPESDYLAIALTDPINNFTYVPGQEIILFTFQNFGICTGPVRLINNDSDPFMPPNSQSVNIGNQFTVLAAGPGVNAYSGNSPMEEVVCPDTDNCQMVVGLDVNMDGRYQINITPDQTWNTPDNTTDFMQFTLKVPADSFSVNDLRSLIPGVQWEATLIAENPTEAPEFDYINITLTTTGTDLISYQQGTTLALFEFVNRSACTENLIALMNNTTDLFAAPNSASVDVGNFIETTGSNGRADMCFTGSETVECIFTDNLPLSIDVTATMDEVACAGDETSITVVAMGDEPPYTVEWTNTTTGETGTATIDSDGGEFVLDPAAAGDYTFTITGNAGSVMDAITTIVSPSAIEATLSSNPTACPDNPSGTATVAEISGGTLSTDYQVVWDDPAASEGRELTGLTAGTYTATITDDNNCSIVRSIDVGASDPLSVTEEVFPLACAGDTDASIDIAVVGGSNDYTVEWSANAINTSPTGADDLTAGIYTVTVTDLQSGCFITESYEIPAIDSLDLQVAVTPPACNENAGTLEILGVNNGLDPYVFSIDGINFSGQTRYTELSPGNYGIIVQDAAGCETIASAQIPTGDIPTLELGEDLTILLGDSIILETFTNADTSSADFSWNGDFDLDCNDCPNPTAKPSKTYTYKLEITNEAGCTVSDRVTIFVDRERQLYFPNAFTPNGDGFNDYFTIYSDKKVTSVNKFQVFDRWGELQFSADENFQPNNEPAGWDGTFRNRPAAIGVYVYQAEITFVDGATEFFSGEITLVR